MVTWVDLPGPTLRDCGVPWAALFKGLRDEMVLLFPKFWHNFRFGMFQFQLLDGGVGKIVRKKPLGVGVTFVGIIFIVGFLLSLSS